MKEKAILFGASNYGKIALDYLKDKYCILYYSDNDQKKWGKYFNGYKIIPPEQLKNINAKVIITSSYYEDISKQLMQMGIYDFQILQFNLKDYQDYVKEEKDKLENSYYMNLRTETLHPVIMSNYDLHLISDHVYCKKFIEFQNKYFPNARNLYILLKNKDYNLKYIDVNVFNNIEVMNIEEMGGRLLLYVKNANRVFIHYLKDYICRFICDYDIKEKLYWKLWGADLYNYIPIELYDELTKKFLERLNYPMRSQLYWSSSVLSYRKKAIKKISYILSGFQYEYHKIKYFYDTNVKLLPFFYPNPIDFSALKNSDETNVAYQKKHNRFAVLIGNSADPTNNHLDMFYALKNKDLKNFDIIVPLSYGGNQEYIEYVIKKGKQFFGNRFIPIMEFMEPEDYFSLLKQIDVAIMNHNRAQAVGNVFALLYLGKPVFLKSETSTFKELTDLGFKLFKVEDLADVNLKSIFEKGSIIDNRIDLCFGEEKAKENWKRILQAE